MISSHSQSKTIGTKCCVFEYAKYSVIAVENVKIVFYLSFYQTESFNTFYPYNLIVFVIGL